MHIEPYNRSRLFGVLLLLFTLTIDRFTLAQSMGAIGNQTTPLTDGSEDREANSKILVEIFLSQEHKGDLDAIKKEFETVSITKVRPQLFQLGNPPENIAIGKNITAPVARLAIRLAITYNRGIKYLLPEERLAPNYIAIGTSIFDESFQVPIRPEDLTRLSDPALTTPQFHAFYRHLTGEDKRPE
jgi:hypothetical protein